MSSSIPPRAATRRGASAGISTRWRSSPSLKATTAPGDARRFAHAAVANGFDFIVAAGGDGTVNEVLERHRRRAGWFCQHTRLGVLPLGTVNVFARELKIPLRLESRVESFAARTRNEN